MQRAAKKNDVRASLWNVRYGAAVMATTVLIAGSAAAQLSGPAVVAPGLQAMAVSPVNAVSEDTNPAANTVDSLPDAPVASSSSVTPAEAAPDSTASALDLQTQKPGRPAPSAVRTAAKYDTVILPDEKAVKLTVHDKLVYGLKDSFSPFSIIGWGLSAGYEQVTDGSPNYGVIGNTKTGKSFAQRLGAAAARDTSETVFAESILAPVFHEDPRYYAQTNRGFIYRVVYAGTRPLITRTDGGRTTINFSNLGGNLAGSALTQAYYPPINRGFDEVLKTFGGSIGGSALGDLASEFLPGLLEAVHFKKRP